MAKNTKVSVPPIYGDELSIRFAGDDAESFAVKDGTVTVPNERVPAFLKAIKGSSLVDGAADPAPSLATTTDVESAVAK